VPPLFDILYTADDVYDYRSTLRGDVEMQRRFNRRLREGGIMKGDSKFYVSLAHDAADIKQTLAAIQSAIEVELAEARVPAQ
jgi:glutamate-1-semialdehyde 2,1-aminomutase